MKVDLNQLGLGDLPDGLIDVAAKLSEDGVELARRWARVAELKAAGIDTTDPRAYRLAVEDAEALAVLCLQRAELHIRELFADLAQNLVQLAAKLVMTTIVSAV